MEINLRVGTCIYCKQTVHPGEGYCFRGKKAWKEIHKECVEKFMKLIKKKK